MRIQTRISGVSPSLYEYKPCSSAAADDGRRASTMALTGGAPRSERMQRASVRNAAPMARWSPVLKTRSSCVASSRSAAGLRSFTGGRASLAS